MTIKKKMVNLFVCVLALITLCTGALTVSAGDETETTITHADTFENRAVMPRWNNDGTCSFNFQVLSPGVAHVSAAYSGSFTQAKLTVKIQKRFLGFFWSTVDIGEPDDEWVSYSSQSSGNFYHSFSVSGTGTYRAQFTLEVTGTDGTVDVMEETLEYTYN